MSHKDKPRLQITPAGEWVRPCDSASGANSKAHLRIACLPFRLLGRVRSHAAWCPFMPAWNTADGKGWHAEADDVASCGTSQYVGSNTLGESNDRGRLHLMPTDPRPALHHNLSSASPLRLTSDSDGAVVLVGVRGRWDWQLFLAVRTAVRKCLVEHPSALILDLRALDDVTGSSASLWFASRSAADGMQPPVRMALCVPPEAPLALRLRRLGAKRFLPIFATVTQARTAVAERLAVPERLRLRLPASPESASLAGVLVADACRAWELPQLLHRARLVMFELVTNAVEHAGTDMLVTVTRRDEGLHLMVRDGSVVLPRRLPVAPGPAGARSDERGEGLQVVEALARAWGARPTDDGTGKVVWATVRPARPHGDDEVRML